MRGNFFWANIDKILTLAFAGTLVSTLVVGWILYAVRYYVSLEDMSLAESLSFAALISATDPVATLATFERLNVDPNLFNIVFGESALNDAVSIVLFHTFAKLVTYDGGLLPLFGFALIDFVVIFVGSALVGFMMGCLAALLFKHVHLRTHSRIHGPQLELAIFLTYCYGPFLLAECLSLSGMVTMLFTGFSMKHYAYRNLSDQARTIVESIVALLANISETIMFLDIGTSAWRSFHSSFALVVFAIFACLVGRAAHVYPSAVILNSRRIEYPRRKFETAHVHIVWFAGLRGAVSYALCYSFPGQYRKQMISTTMAIVLSSVWFLGGATLPFLRFLGTRQLQPDELKQLSLTLEPAINRQPAVKWERKHLRPLLLISDPSDEEAGTEMVGGALASPRTLTAWAADPDGLLQRSEQDRLVSSDDESSGSENAVLPSLHEIPPAADPHRGIHTERRSPLV